MASRWFVFWIAMFIVAEVKDSGYSLLWLFFAILTSLTSDPAQEIERKLTKRALDLLRASEKSDGGTKPTATSK